MEKDMIGGQRHVITLSILSRLVEQNHSVMEVGSNDASFRDRFDSRSWTTVDKYGDPDVRIDISGPQVRLPFPDDNFDLVICTEVLEHLTLGSPFVSEMTRVMKPNGVALISVPNISSLKSRIKMLLGGLPNLAASGDCGTSLGGSGILNNEGHWVAGHVVDFNKARLAGYLNRGGFRNLKWHSVPVNFSSAGFVATLPAWLLPQTFSDFLIVEARKNDF